MSDKERKAYLQARKRNLERKYAKLLKHADLIEETIECKADLDAVERELKLMWIYPLYNDVAPKIIWWSSSEYKTPDVKLQLIKNTFSYAFKNIYNK